MYTSVLVRCVFGCDTSVDFEIMLQSNSVNIRLVYSFEHLNMRSLIALNWVKNCTHYGKKIKIKSELEHAYCLHAGIYDQPTDGSVFQES